MRSLFSTPTARFLRSPAKAPTVLVIDVNNFGHRMHHAYSELQTSKGDPSGHVYGALNNLKMLTNQIKGRICTVFVSDGEPIERLALYPDYKKPRRLAKDEDKAQMLLEVNRVLHLFPGMVAFCPSAEADDTIATVAKEQLRKGKKVFVVSGDHDLWALAAHGAKIVASKKLGTLDKKGVEKKMGIPPLCIRLHKAMYGDKSDWYKGVPRLQKKVFGMIDAVTIEGLKDQLDRLPKSHRERIQEHWDIIERNWNLAELKTVNYTTHQCGNPEALLELAKSYECKSLFPWIEGLE